MIGKGFAIMNKHKLTPDEMKQVAHHMAQRSLSTIAPLMWDSATKQYLEIYNNVMDKLEEYNSKD